MRRSLSFETLEDRNLPSSTPLPLPGITPETNQTIVRVIQGETVASSAARQAVSELDAAEASLTAEETRLLLRQSEIKAAIEALTGRVEVVTKTPTLRVTVSGGEAVVQYTDLPAGYVFQISRQDNPNYVVGGAEYAPGSGTIRIRPPQSADTTQLIFRNTRTDAPVVTGIYFFMRYNELNSVSKSGQTFDMGVMAWEERRVDPAGIAERERLQAELATAEARLAAIRGDLAALETSESDVLRKIPTLEERERAAAEIPHAAALDAFFAEYRADLTEILGAYLDASEEAEVLLPVPTMDTVNIQGHPAYVSMGVTYADFPPGTVMRAWGDKGEVIGDVVLDGDGYFDVGVTKVSGSREIRMKFFSPEEKETASMTLHPYSQEDNGRHFSLPAVVGQEGGVSGSITTSYAMQNITMPDIERIAKGEVRQMAGLGITKTKEQIGMHWHPELFGATYAESMAKIEALAISQTGGAWTRDTGSVKDRLITSYHQNLALIGRAMDVAEQMIENAAYLAYRDLLHTYTGVQNASPWDGKMVHPQGHMVSEVGMELPSENQVRYAVSRHFREIYGRLNGIAEDDRGAVDRVQRETSRVWNSEDFSAYYARHPDERPTTQLAQETIHRTVELILASEGTGTAEERVGRYLASVGAMEMLEGMGMRGVTVLADTGKNRFGAYGGATTPPEANGAAEALAQFSQEEVYDEVRSWYTGNQTPFMRTLGFRRDTLVGQVMMGGTDRLWSAATSYERWYAALQLQVVTDIPAEKLVAARETDDPKIFISRMQALLAEAQYGHILEGQPAQLAEPGFITASANLPQEVPYTEGMIRIRFDLVTGGQGIRRIMASLPNGRPVVLTGAATFMDIPLSAVAQSSSKLVFTIRAKLMNGRELSTESTPVSVAPRIVERGPSLVGHPGNYSTNTDATMREKENAIFQELGFPLLGTVITNLEKSTAHHGNGLFALDLSGGTASDVLAPAEGTIEQIDLFSGQLILRHESSGVVWFTTFYHLNNILTHVTDVRYTGLQQALDAMDIDASYKTTVSKAIENRHGVQGKLDALYLPSDIKARVQDVVNAVLSAQDTLTTVWIAQWKKEGRKFTSADGPLAQMGNEGFSTGKHLHMQVNIGSFLGTPVDLFHWLNAQVPNIQSTLPVAGRGSMQASWNDSANSLVNTNEYLAFKCVDVNSTTAETQVYAWEDAKSIEQMHRVIWRTISNVQLENGDHFSNYSGWVRMDADGSIWEWKNEKWTSIRLIN